MTAPSQKPTRSRRPVAVIAGVVLGLGALGGITGAALGGIGAAAGFEHSEVRPGGHEHHHEDGDTDPAPAPRAPANLPAAPPAPPR